MFWTYPTSSNVRIPEDSATKRAQEALVFIRLCKNNDLLREEKERESIGRQRGG